jgi:hypothetical protein
VPNSYNDLVRTLRSFIAFAASFAALVWIWYLPARAVHGPSSGRRRRRLEKAVHLTAA